MIKTWGVYYIVCYIKFNHKSSQKINIVCIYKVVFPIYKCTSILMSSSGYERNASWQPIREVVGLVPPFLRSEAPCVFYNIGLYSIYMKWLA